MNLNYSLFENKIPILSFFSWPGPFLTSTMLDLEFATYIFPRNALGWGEYFLKKKKIGLENSKLAHFKS